MTYKPEFMRTTGKILFAAALLMLAIGCGRGTAGSTGELATKKADLEKLKTDKASLDDKIRKLELEIAKLDTTAGEAKARQVVAIAISERAYDHYIDLQGRIDADDISYVTPRGGAMQPSQVKAVYVKKGDFVKKGQLLAKLDDAVQLKQLETLKTQLAFAEDVYRRQKNLWDQGIGTEIQLKTSENNVNSLKDQINTLTTNWDMSNVRSDVSGYVEQMNLRPGEAFVGLAGNTFQIQIVNTNSLKVVTEVPENYLDRIRKGSPVSIHLPDANLDLNSSISLIGQVIGANSRSVQTEARIPFNPNIHVNQIAQVRIRDYSNPKAIVVPLTTVQTDEKGKYVFVVATENGKKVARKKQVLVGEIYGEEIEVKSGLIAGDQLVTEGFQSLYEGQPVKLN